MRYGTDVDLTAFDQTREPVPKLSLHVEADIDLAAGMSPRAFRGLTFTLWQDGRPLAGKTLNREEILKDLPLLRGLLEPRPVKESDGYPGY